MIKKIIFIAFLLSLLTSQTIIHDPIYILQPGKSLDIEASIIGYLGPQSDATVTLFYRSYSQQTFFNSRMTYINGKYKFSIPASFIKGAIEYYIILEIKDGRMYAFPANDPMDNPVLVKSKDYDNSSKDISSMGVLIPKYEILSPEPDSYILSEELFISLSYFKMDDIDEQSTRIYINNVDYTDLTNFKSSHLILIPDQSLPAGEYEAKVVFKNKVGLAYQPIFWKFNIISGESTQNQRIMLSQNGNVSGNYNNTSSDNILLEVGQVAGDYNLDLDWLKFKYRFLISSLEDINKQTKNRMSFNFKTEYFNIKIGDSYPSFSEYSINGNRMRGLNINYKNNTFDFSFLSGSLARETQGLASDEAMLLSENQSPIFQASGFLDEENIGIINVSRNNYAFDQGLLGVKLSYKTSEKFRFKFELLKIKDKIQSVDQIVDNSILFLPETMVQHLYSDLFVDYNGNGLFDESEYIGDMNQTDHDVVGSTSWDDADVLSNINLDNFLTYTLNLVNVGTFSEEPYEDINSDGTWNDGEFFLDIDLDGEWSNDSTYNVLQEQWEISIYNEKLESVINDFMNNEELLHTGEDGSIDMSDCTYNNCFGDYDVNLLDDQWEGVKPQDNIVITTDFLHSLDNGAMKINYGFGFSMLNQNIWNPSLTYKNLDEMGADTEADSTDGLFNGAPIPDAVNQLDNLENIFQTGTSQVPLIPIDITDGITFKDFLTLPSVAIYFDVSQKYFGHKINWGFKQVGPQYNTLGNPYIQTDIREQYFSDRAYILDNKLNILFKWKRTEDGISIIQDNGQTDKYDFNFGFYPGANLPTYNLSVGIYNRTNGIDPLYNPVLVVTAEGDINGNGLVDSLSCQDAFIYDYICNEDELELDSNSDYGMIEEHEILSTQLYQPEKTRTGQFNLSINSTVDYIYKHRINLNIYYSNKKDLVDIDKYLLLNSDYYSPRSMTQSYYLGIVTSISDRLESSLSLNYNYYDYGYATEEHAEYFQFQRIFGMNLNFVYDTHSLLGKIDPGINLSIGRGNTEFTQLSLKMGSHFQIIDNLYFNLNMNYKLKVVDEGTFYNNYSMIIDLKYKF
jgi:hypothetical protein